MATNVALVARGRALLRDARLNRGTAFTHEQRAALDLEGLLAAAVTTLERQATRTYEQYRTQPTDLARNDSSPPCTTATRCSTTGCSRTTSGICYRSSTTPL